MTSDEYPPCPGQYTYEPFGTGQPYPGGPATDKATPPKTVTYAFYSMLAGASLSLIGLLYSFTQLSHAHQTAATHGKGHFTDSQLDTIVTVAYVLSTAISLISIGLWIWMAFATRAGKNWARITGSVLFGLNTLSMLDTVIITSSSTTLDTILAVLTWLVGLATLILLWIKQSGAYFRPSPTYTPYGPGLHPEDPQGF
ncbi:MAG: hypothetical protein JWN03_5220 [Nocardia sp.]|uniref:hypothetical protein n=1 Tax=Nocardia sp. TaxID=1821 RepID=UPI002614B8A9|nr:hypothetical protein [Nocardia sp.]MCU1644945.1 hypothetical protein [Nocardia sp.]